MDIKQIRLLTGLTQKILRTISTFLSEHYKIGKAGKGSTSYVVELIKEKAEK